MTISEEVWRVVLGVLLSFALGVIWWYHRQRHQRIMLLESAVFGHTGVHEKLSKYVTHEEFRNRLSDLTTHIKGLNEEGVAREERIIEAIKNQGSLITADMRDIKADVRATNVRIDTIISNGR